MAYHTRLSNSMLVTICGNCYDVLDLKLCGYLMEWGSVSLNGNPRTLDVTWEYIALIRSISSNGKGRMSKFSVIADGRDSG